MPQPRRRAVGARDGLRRFARVWRARSPPARRRSPDRAAAPLDAGGCRGLEDRVHVQAMNAIEVGNVTGLTEVVDAERIGAVAGHAAEPRQARGMPVDDGDERGIRPEGAEQSLDVRRRARRALRTGALRGRPAARGGDRRRSRRAAPPPGCPRGSARAPRGPRARAAPRTRWPARRRRSGARSSSRRPAGRGADPRPITRSGCGTGRVDRRR